MCLTNFATVTVPVFIVKVTPYVGIIPPVIACPSDVNSYSASGNSVIAGVPVVISGILILILLLPLLVSDSQVPEIVLVPFGTVSVPLALKTQGQRFVLVKP